VESIRLATKFAIVKLSRNAIRLGFISKLLKTSRLLPITIHASTTAEVPVNIPIWNNDYDPEGAIDVFLVVIHTLPQNGTLDG
jgi:hypothetical protein